MPFSTLVLPSASSRETMDDLHVELSEGIIGRYAFMHFVLEEPQRSALRVVI